jgi:hypothetical protein
VLPEHEGVRRFVSGAVVVLQELHTQTRRNRDRPHAEIGLRRHEVALTIKLLRDCDPACAQVDVLPLQAERLGDPVARTPTELDQRAPGIVRGFDDAARLVGGRYVHPPSGPHLDALRLGQPERERQAEQTDAETRAWQDEVLVAGKPSPYVTAALPRPAEPHELWLQSVATDL